jgi:membrane protein
MGVPGQSIVKKGQETAEAATREVNRAANKVDIPMTGKLGLADFVKRYFISLVLALSSAVLMIGALVLVLFGSAIGQSIADHVGLGHAFTLTWSIVQWPVLLVFVLVAFALVYYLAPNVDQQIKFITPGSIVAVVLWVLFSGLFSLYVRHFGSFNRVYGTLAGVVILMLFLYYSGMFLLMGAEMNQIIEEHAPGGRSSSRRAARHSS